MRFKHQCGKWTQTVGFVRFLPTVCVCAHKNVFNKSQSKLGPQEVTIVMSKSTTSLTLLCENLNEGTQDSDL